MTRLGGNLGIMLMVEYSGTRHALEELVAGVAESMDLHLHVDNIEAHPHQHLEPDVRITVCGADRAGIVAKVTAALAEAGLHITDLQAGVDGSDDKPGYALHIEGHAGEGIHAIESALAIIREDAGFEVSMMPISTVSDQVG
jgi:glycine cleavage system transcriptional repressor